MQPSRGRAKTSHRQGRGRDGWSWETNRWLRQALNSGGEQAKAPGERVRVCACLNFFIFNIDRSTIYAAWPGMWNMNVICSNPADSPGSEWFIHVSVSLPFCYSRHKTTQQRTVRAKRSDFLFINLSCEHMFVCVAEMCCLTGFSHRRLFRWRVTSAIDTVAQRLQLKKLVCSSVAHVFISFFKPLFDVSLIVQVFVFLPVL